MNRSLYEINKDYLNAIESSFEIDEETGEIVFDEKILEALDQEFNSKADNIACVIKDMTMFTKDIDNEIKALQDRKKVNVKRIESLTNYLVNSMQLREIDKLETPRNKISYRKSKLVQIINESVLEEKYLRVTTKVEADKKAIMEALKSGEIVSGAMLVEKQNLQIK